MGLFGPSKIKITPIDFVRTQLDKIFSDDFMDAEYRWLEDLSKETSVLQKINRDRYLKERQNVIYNLLQIAWDRNTSQAIFVEYSTIMLDDPRVKAINSGVYDMCLSKAQEAGMGTFGFISKIFISQIIPQDAGINEADYSKLYEVYGTDFTKRYMSFEALIKQYRFIT